MVDEPLLEAAVTGGATDAEVTVIVAEADMGVSPSPLSDNVAVLVICPAGAELDTKTGTTTVPIEGLAEPPLFGVNIQVTTLLLPLHEELAKLEPVTEGVPSSVM